jgi:hypothetical protein
MEDIAHLYKITSQKTGEYYIGKHRGLTQETRWGKLYWGSGTRIQNHVKKYGTGDLTYEILCISTTNYIFELESKYVTKELLQNELCLNIVTGGREPPSKKGFVITEETRKKLRARTPWNKGRKFSEETKKKMSEAALGRKHSEETIQKFLGRTPWNKDKTGYKIHTEEHKKILSEKLKGNKNSVGYKHSEEWKQQNSIRNKGNKFNVGRKHMNDGQKNYFVTEKDIQEKNLFHLVPGRLKVGV